MVFRIDCNHIIIRYFVYMIRCDDILRNFLVAQHIDNEQDRQISGTDQQIMWSMHLDFMHKLIGSE